MACSHASLQVHSGPVKLSLCSLTASRKGLLNSNMNVVLSVEFDQEPYQSKFSVQGRFPQPHSVFLIFKDSEGIGFARDVPLDQLVRDNLLCATWGPRNCCKPKNSLMHRGYPRHPAIMVFSWQAIRTLSIGFCHPSSLARGPPYFQCNDLLVQDYQAAKGSWSHLVTNKKAQAFADKKPTSVVICWKPAQFLGESGHGVNLCLVKEFWKDLCSLGQKFWA